ncbi:hypothetical protein Sarmat_01133 [Rickettsiales endosymbiont of Paramecium tredecaurelia]|nr:hypothetical protein [Candidatus Sarmatiella mevalonica]
MKLNDFSVSNANRYSGFRSLKNEGSKNLNPLKPRQIKGLRACVPSGRVFNASGDGEGKTEILGVKWRNWRKGGTYVVQR